MPRSRALARLAAQYDGTDRYQLEAINIAAGDRKPALYDRLAKSGGLNLQKLPLVQVLNPAAAAEFLVAQLNKGGLDREGERSLIDAAGSIAAPGAGLALLRWAAQGSGPVELRRLALETVAANLAGNWQQPGR